MDFSVLPTKIGQICKIIEPMEDENPEDVYILTEDPSKYNSNSILYVANLRDLQRNIGAPFFTPQKAVKKSDLTVVAESLEDYAESLNLHE